MISGLLEKLATKQVDPNLFLAHGTLSYVVSSRGTLSYVMSSRCILTFEFAKMREPLFTSRHLAFTSQVFVGLQALRHVVLVLALFEYYYLVFLLLKIHSGKHYFSSPYQQHHKVTEVLPMESRMTTVCNKSCICTICSKFIADKQCYKFMEQPKAQFPLQLL